MISKPLKDFSHIQAMAGFWTVAALILAQIVIYIGPRTVLNTLTAPLAMSHGAWTSAQPLFLWLNEAGMALIFLLIGLELKRGLMEDEMSGPIRLRLPLVAALGGLFAPLIPLAALNWGESALATAWPVPLGTDMALGLGILALFGERIPPGLKHFFLSACLLMNIGTLLLAAGMGLTRLAGPTLTVVGICLVLLVIMNLARVMAFSLYAVVGVVLWAALAASGPPAALAGLLLALAVPMQSRDRIVLPGVEHDLHRAVGLVLIPVLVFVDLGIMGREFPLLAPWTMGVAAGLFVGKQLGILGLCWLGVQAGFCDLPAGVGWRELAGAAALCGIGGGMSLGWAVLAGSPLAAETRTAILAASLLSALAGYGLLRHVLAQRRNKVLQRI